jgi:hypothetical protein
MLKIDSDDKCFICGCKVNTAFLQRWNGEDVCKFCVRELNEEAEKFLQDCD